MKYLGVTRNVGRENLPWKAQICFGGKTCCIGNFAGEREAAEAYDNAAFYLNSQSVRKREFALNCPDAYSREPYPPPTLRTLQILEKAQVTTEKSGAEEIPKGRAELLQSLKRAYEAAENLMHLQKAFGQSVLSELTTAIKSWEEP
jgi:hypothetical protein